MTIQQISVFLENRTGQLSPIADALAENGIDLRAIHVAETADYGVLRLIVDRPSEAANVLLEHGFVISMTPVQAVAVPDRPGELAKLLDTLAKAEVDIAYMYSVFGQRDGQAYMIFRVTDPARMEAALVGSGVCLSDGRALGMK